MKAVKAVSKMEVVVVFVIAIVLLIIGFVAGCGTIDDACSLCHKQCQSKGSGFHPICDPNSFSSDSCVCVEE